MNVRMHCYEQRVDNDALTVMLGCIAVSKGMDLYLQMHVGASQGACLWAAGLGESLQMHAEHSEFNIKHEP